MPVSARTANNPISKPVTGGQQRPDLLRSQRRRHPAGHRHRDRPGRDRAALRDVMQERLVASPPRSPPGDQPGGQRHPRTGVEVVEPEHSPRMAVEPSTAPGGTRWRPARSRCRPGRADRLRTGRRPPPQPDPTPRPDGRRTRTRTSGSTRKRARTPRPGSGLTDSLGGAGRSLSSRC